MAKPNTNIQAFNFAEGISVRSMLDKNNAPWFVAADVCNALGLTNTTKALLRLDEDEQALITIQGKTNGNDQANIINESGLYSLILTSRKDEAKRFKKWVTSEVLPTIRKTGSYGAGKPPALPPAKPTYQLPDNATYYYLSKVVGGVEESRVLATEERLTNHMRNRFTHLEIISKEIMVENLQLIMGQVSQLCGQFSTYTESKARFAKATDAYFERVGGAV